VSEQQSNSVQRLLVFLGLYFKQLDNKHILSA